jgi:hypothetical protein
MSPPRDHPHIEHVSAAMSLRYGRLFDATVRDEYDRALVLAKERLGPLLPEQRTALPIAAITGGDADWQDTPLIKSRLAGGYCLHTPVQGPCAYASICEHCPNFRNDPPSCPSWPPGAPTPRPSPPTPAAAAGTARPPGSASSSNPSTCSCHEPRRHDQRRLPRPGRAGLPGPP